MSSDEDLSLSDDIMDLSEDTLKGLQALIDKCKKQDEQLLQEQKELVASMDDADEMLLKFTDRTQKIKQSTEDNDSANADKLDKETENWKCSDAFTGLQKQLEEVKQEEDELEAELRRIQATLEEEEATFAQLQDRTNVFASMPERNVVFKGQMEKMGTRLFDMKAHIVHPVEGGTALVTFEEEKVAQAIIAKGTHVVQLGGDCRISVEARPFHLLVPDYMEIDTDVCPRRVLISDLPDMDVDIMLNKLEIHFSKSRNGGGEVEECVYLDDSQTVVIAFLDEIARDLTSRLYHEVPLDKKKTHKVRVTPFLNGTITNFKTEFKACQRTVLLTGIPDVMEAENIQDLLEIHFQKNANGGGEIEAIMYNAPGEEASAVFRSSAPQQNAGQQVKE